MFYYQMESLSIEMLNTSLEDQNKDNSFDKQEETKWGAPLVEQIQKPSCGCQRRFDPIAKKEVLGCSAQFPLLIHLCRNAILKVIHLSAIEEAPYKLPLPNMLTREICKLHLNDFIIDPLKVRNQDLCKNLYNAVVSFSQQEVSVEILNGGKKKENLPSNQNFITSFEDKGLLCLVWDPVLSLEEIIRGHSHVGQQLPSQFMWQVVKSVSQHIIGNGHSYSWKLGTSVVKVTKNKSMVYIDSDDNDPSSVNTFLNMNHSPEIVAKKPFNPEKAFIWCLGSLLYEMLTLSPFAYHPTARPHNPSSAFYLQRISTGKMLDSFNQCSDPVLKNLAQDCLQDEPSVRPSVRDIMKLAKLQCQKSNHSASVEADSLSTQGDDKGKFMMKPNKAKQSTEKTRSKRDSKAADFTTVKTEKVALNNVRIPTRRKH